MSDMNILTVAFQTYDTASLAKGVAGEGVTNAGWGLGSAVAQYFATNDGKLPAKYEETIKAAHKAGTGKVEMPASLLSNMKVFAKAGAHGDFPKISLAWDAWVEICEQQEADAGNRFNTVRNLLTNNYKADVEHVYPLTPQGILEFDSDKGKRSLKSLLKTLVNAVEAINEHADMEGYPEAFSADNIVAGVKAHAPHRFASKPKAGKGKKVVIPATTPTPTPTPALPSNVKTLPTGLDIDTALANMGVTRGTASAEQLRAALIDTTTVSPKGKGNKR